MLATLVLALSLALGLGSLARWLHLPPLFGYLVAGVAIGPHTPGFVGDAALTATLAEVGVALLLFGVGLHFRLQDLRAVWHIALPGAAAQVAVAALLGGLLGRAGLGLGPGAALIFGLALGIASTVVATRMLAEAGQIGGPAGRIALGWLVVQDLLAVLALVMVPAAARAETEGLATALLGAVLELLGFAVCVLLIGRRGLPALLARLARAPSGELFTLGVIVAALGTAYAASELFHVSFALGAFFAGMLLGESDLGHQAAAEAMPLQRIFAALFFVSVGMLLEPAALLAAPLLSLGALLVVLCGIGGATFLLLLLARVPPAMAATVAGALAQIAEFSFLLTSYAIGQGLLPPAANAPVLAAAFGGILLLPLTQRGFAWLGGRVEGSAAWRRRSVAHPAALLLRPEAAGLADHAIIVGFGRVGAVVTEALRHHGLDLVVIDADRLAAERAQARGLEVLWGDASRAEVLRAARPETARLVVLALPDAAAARRVLQLVRAANAAVQVAVRVHAESDLALLQAEDCVGLAVMGEREIALGISDFALRRLGIEAEAAQATIERLRAGLPAAP
ncbi:cation:proton antiporter [Roseicella sp. DB1501]|uniref:cation:proton antiporter domain-containing protein n=1 Tax=Roseicella sp. DB1501 TaxID=2730925 RepID=UPI001491F3D6|nr:cation:proton antiporter [Roseicella sp. DB1501]NOG68833.1 sodium:proton antiporter [Roseicella sp. DB1501]